MTCVRLLLVLMLVWPAVCGAQVRDFFLQSRTGTSGNMTTIKVPGGNGKVWVLDGSGNLIPATLGTGLTLSSGTLTAAGSTELDSDLASIAALPTTSFGRELLTVANAAALRTVAGAQASGNYITALTGDVTAAGPGSVAATLANTGVGPGSYANATITVDAKGRVTYAANGTTRQLKP